MFASFISDMGIYNNLGRVAQPDGKALVLMSPMLLKLLEVCPKMEISPGQISQALQQLVMQAPEVNTTIYNGRVWAGAQQERITNILYHIRRLAKEKDRLIQVCLPLQAEELKLLRSMISQVEVPPCDNVSESLAPTVVCAPGSPGSPASIDSSGFPLMLSRESPEPSRPMAVLKGNTKSSGFPTEYPEAIAKSPAKALAKASVKSKSKSGALEGSPAASSVPRDEDFAALMGLQPKAQPKATSKKNAKVKAKANGAKAKGAKAKAKHCLKKPAATKQEAVATDPQGFPTMLASKPSKQTSYDQLKKEFSGSKDEWVQSVKRHNAIMHMTLSEVKRRRFERFRPDICH